MSIPKCCGEVVKNSANGKEFFYCRQCKKEVAEQKDGIVFLGPGDPKLDQWFDPNRIISYDGSQPTWVNINSLGYEEHDWRNAMLGCSKCGMSLLVFNTTLCPCPGYRGVTKTP
jgi:hypothetical protein